MLGADKVHLAISSLRMKTTPFCFWEYLINSSITLTRPGMPDILSCVLIDIMRRREAVQNCKAEPRCRSRESLIDEPSSAGGVLVEGGDCLLVLFLLHLLINPRVRGVRDLRQ